MSQQTNQMNIMDRWHINAKLCICHTLTSEMVVTSSYKQFMYLYIFVHFIPYFTQIYETAFGLLAKEMSKVTNKLHQFIRRYLLHRVNQRVDQVKMLSHKYGSVINGKIMGCLSVL